jgi:hypothetical protein
MGFNKERNVTGVRRYWPVIGFLMLVAIAIISWFLAPEAIALTRNIIPRFTGRELPVMTMRIVFTVLLTFLLGALSAAVLALATPKPKDQVREGDMLKEREELVKRKAMERERTRRLNRELRRK